MPLLFLTPRTYGPTQLRHLGMLDGAPRGTMGTRPFLLWSARRTRLTCGHAYSNVIQSFMRRRGGNSTVDGGRVDVLQASSVPLLRHSYRSTALVRLNGRGHGTGSIWGGLGTECAARHGFSFASHHRSVASGGRQIVGMGGKSRGGGGGGGREGRRCKRDIGMVNGLLTVDRIPRFLSVPCWTR